MAGNAIYSASVVSGGLAGYPTVYYDRVAAESPTNVPVTSIPTCSP